MTCCDANQGEFNSCQNEMQTAFPMHSSYGPIWSSDFEKLHFQLILGYFHFRLDVPSMSDFQISEE